MILYKAPDGGGGDSMRLSDLPPGTVVKIGLNSGDWPFIVVHHGQPSSLYDTSFKGGTILLMKDIYEARRWHSTDLNDYANSTIHSYLNNEFYALINSQVQAQIIKVKIPYRPGAGTSSTVNSGADGLPAYIWLLGGYEVNWSTVTSQYFPVDGVTLAYFDGTSEVDEKRAANLSGTAADYWLRSPGLIGATIAWRVGAAGQRGSGNCSTLLGVRPALVLPDTTFIVSKPNPDGTYNLKL